MQFVRPYQIFRLLCNVSFHRREQLRTDRGIQHILQYCRKFPVFTGIRIIVHQMSHQCLWYTGIDAIHGHMVSVVGGPAQCQFRHIPCTDDQCIFLVCDVHQHLRAFPGLPIFIDNIMTFHILPDIGKMSGHRFSDIHFPQSYTQSLRQQAGIFIRPVRCSEAGHGHCYNSFSGKLQQVKGTHRHQQCQCGIQSSGDSEDRRF